MTVIYADSPAQNKWRGGSMVSWADGVATETADGGKTWRKYTLDMTPCECCGNPLLKRIYQD